MSVLLGADGRKDDVFAAVDDISELSLNDGPVLVPLTVIDEALTHRRNVAIGLAVDNNAPVCALEEYFDKVALIAVAFPSFSDGRGFTLAKRLRRAGFTGTLRARGPLIADEFHDALACGFDEVEVPDEMAARQPPEQWLRQKAIVSAHYQNGYGEGLSILQQRARARKAAAE
ncbi:DUF934 domain-containing protein [Aureimonas leprariae]|uniref:DUF934 domain-containing protein n=1 Tax=Plantimonas leprariae TaxID=2615207 RepID=A0A7V7PRS7_9HYPH|nr:DUF934 domain-containing protein [Aureimonas leprariae]KAB0681462.1 DUF934 domain-containing protein [Aureimonas leprariae]